jgi:threonine/homoserine/homoserine lactone efflux protein
MKALELLLRGIAAGLAISAPVGPVNVYCISRTLTKGKLAGLVAGLGAAVVDTFYGAIAGFSISLVIGFLIREQFWLRLVGGILLMAIGIVYYALPPKTLSREDNSTGESDFVTAFLMTLTNPTTVLSFLAVLAALDLGGHRPARLTLVLVGGIFAGSMCWWTILATVANHFRDRFDDRAMLWMNRIAGVAIGTFGLATMLLSRVHR